MKTSTVTTFLLLGLFLILLVLFCLAKGIELSTALIITLISLLVLGILILGTSTSSKDQPSDTSFYKANSEDKEIKIVFPDLWSLLPNRDAPVEIKIKQLEPLERLLRIIFGKENPEDK